MSVRCLRVGLAGWNNPPAMRALRGAEVSHLAFYASHFPCVEINSSFYKTHQTITYRRWRDETPEAFRFSVKMPRSITHESRLQRCASEVERFYAQISYLQPKLSAVLVQLPPSLEFNKRVVTSFFKKLPFKRGVRVICEPRHASWFSGAADELLSELHVARAASDPARHPGAEQAAGWARVAYYRWHGWPRMYYSAYTVSRLEELVESLAKTTTTSENWCIFDNTAHHAAWNDALTFMASANGATLSS